MKFITLENLSQFWSNIKKELDNIKASMGNKADKTELPKTWETLLIMLAT